MPIAARKPCARPGCGALLAPGVRYCRVHARAAEHQRGTSTQRGYTARWHRAAKQHLRANPLCVACEMAGITTAATEVDHIIPHQGDQRLFWDAENWQSLCKPCHTRKTNREMRR